MGARAIVSLLVLAGCYDGPTPFEGEQAPDSSSAADAPAAFCPAGYEGGYRFVTTPASLIDAGDICARDDDGSTGGYFTHLVVVSDASELAALVGRSGTQAFTLGHTDVLVEGEYRSVTLEDPAFVPAWTTGEPADNHDCAVLEPDGQIYVRPCLDARAFICECDRFANVPERYQTD